MAKQQYIDECDYKEALQDSWKVPTTCEKWFPQPVAKWISHHALLLGVPETYISLPFLVATAYCLQHTTVKMDFHTEPTILYGLVGGRSGTNKSTSLQLITDLLSNIDTGAKQANHLFDSGTLEGLYKVCG